MQPVRSLYVYVNFVNVQASSKEVHLNLWGLVIFLTEKQMNFAAGCIFVSSTENCTNLWCVIAFQGCVIISATILKCASLAVHLVFVLRTFEERLVCCYSSKLVRRAFVSGSRRIGPNGPKRIRAHVRRATLTAQ